MSLISSKEDFDHLSKLQEQNGEEYKDAAEEVEDSGKRKGKQIKENIPRKLSTLAFYLGVAFHHQSLQSLIVSLAKA